MQHANTPNNIRYLLQLLSMSARLIRVQGINRPHTEGKKQARLRFVEVKVETRDGQHIFDVQVYLNDLDPKTVQVELFAVGVNGSDPVRQEMKLIRRLEGLTGGYVYGAQVLATRMATDYTARMMPYFAVVAVPLEEARVLWQKCLDMWRDSLHPMGALAIC